MYKTTCDVLDPIVDVEDDANEIRLNFLAGLQIIEEFLHK